MICFACLRFAARRGVLLQRIFAYGVRCGAK